MRKRNILGAAVLFAASMGVVSAKADSIVYQSGDMTISAIGPLVTGDDWAQTFSVTQGHDWDQMGIQYVTGSGPFMSPGLSNFSTSLSLTAGNAAFTGSQLTVLDYTNDAVLTTQSSGDLGNYPVNYYTESFTASFAPNTPTGVTTFNLYTFYQGNAERDVQIMYDASTGSYSSKLFNDEYETGNGSGPYGNAVPLSVFTATNGLPGAITSPLPASSSLGAALFGGFGLFSLLKKFRRSNVSC